MALQIGPKSSWTDIDSTVIGPVGLRERLMSAQVFLGKLDKNMRIIEYSQEEANAVD